MNERPSAYEADELTELLYPAIKGMFSSPWYIPTKSFTFVGTFDMFFDTTVHINLLCLVSFLSVSLHLDKSILT